MVHFFSYSKEENLEPGNPKLHSFSYLLIEARSKYSMEMKLYQQSHDIVEYVDCFSSIGLQYQSLFPVKVKTKPCIGILKRKKYYENLQILDHGTDNEDENRLDEKEAVGDQLDDYLNDQEFKDALMIDREPKLEIEEDIDLIKEITEIDEPEIFLKSEKISDLQNQQIKDDQVKDPIDNLKPNIDEDRVQEKEITPKEEPEKLLVKEDTPQPEEKIDGSIDMISEKEEKDLPKDQIIDTNKKLNVRARSKLKDLIESHYRSKGTVIEFDHNQRSVPLSQPSQISAKTNIKRIIKSVKIMELVDKISKLQLDEYCDLERLSTKDCLKFIIDNYDDKL